MTEKYIINQEVKALAGAYKAYLNGLCGDHPPKKPKISKVHILIFDFFLNLYIIFQQVFSKNKNRKYVFVNSRYEDIILSLNKNDVSSIQTFDIGIMPIANDEWSKGKSSYKMLLYASCGIPVVVDLIGENRKILEEAEIGMGPVGSDEWYDAIEYLILNDSDRKRLGNIGRDYVVRTKSIKTYAPIISNLIIKNV